MRLSYNIKNKLFVVFLFWLLSLIGSIILYYFLDSIANIEYKGVSIAGSVAVFYIIYKLLANVYFKDSTPLFDKNESVEQKLKKLEEMIQEQIKTELLNNFVIPANYSFEISKEFKFGFCYPQDWSFSRFPQQTQYGVIKDQSSGKIYGFSTNFNIIISDISDSKSNLNEIYNAGLSVLNILPNSNLIDNNDFLFNGLQARKHRIDYIDNKGLELTAYQVLVADESKERLFVLTFTTVTSQFNTNKTTFDDILSTFRF